MRVLGGALYGGSGGLFPEGPEISKAAVQRIKTRADKRSVIVSSEGFLGSLWDVYADASDVATQLDESFYDVELQVVLYLRPQLEWVTSVYSQRVHEGYDDAPEPFVDSMLNQPNIEYTNLVSTVIDILGRHRVVVRPYLSGSDVVEDFYQLVGLGSVPRPIRDTRANVSVTPAQVALLRCINERGDRALSARARWAFQGPLSHRDLTALSPIPESSQIRLDAAFRRDWLALADLVEGTPHACSGSFRQAVLRAPDFLPRQYVGTHVEDDLVAAEALQALVQLLPSDTRSPSAGRPLPSRVLRKLRQDPTDVAAATVRSIARGLNESRG